jgi:hypothetical protein
MTIPLNPEIMKSRIQKLKNECHGSVADGSTHTEVTEVTEVLKDSKKWMHAIDRSGQLSYFLRDPLSDLRDLCVNLCSFGLSRMS